MANNPSLSPVDTGTYAGTTPANPLNNPGVNNRQGLNTFDLSFQNLMTQRYGEIQPFFYMEGVPRDRIELRMSHELRGDIMDSPLMSAIRMHKSCFTVPISAMMPNTWQYIIKNPVRGNDIPDDVKCSFDIVGFASSLYDSISKYMLTDDAFIYFASSCWRRFLILYSIKSKGSLLDSLGIRFTEVPFDVDKFVDTMCNRIASALGEQILTFTASTGQTGSIHGDVSFIMSSDLSEVRNAIEMMLEYPNYTVVGGDNASVKTVLTDLFKKNFVGLTNATGQPINLYKVIAYQMICAQYFTNDNVDSVYTAEMWLDNMYNLELSILSSRPSSSFFFDYNGAKIPYDVFSSYFLSYIFSSFPFYVGDDSLFFYFLANLFSYRRSLKYGDYFMSARTRPLAVGDVSISVDSNKVQALDVTRNLSKQRFLNAVNRAGSRIKQYAQSIFGVAPAVEPPQPNFICRTTSYIGNPEVENTADEQGALTSNLIDKSSDYAFDIFIDDFCIVLGVSDFECTGCYSQSCERENFHVDRFDFFNPFLQNIGDQSVSLAELGQLSKYDEVNGYQQRNAEYKFKYNQAHGGFCYNLPSWAFINNQNRMKLSEDMIRSAPKDFDQFYKSLTYSSMAGYYHFKVSYVNMVRANRAMQYSPSLL